MLNNRKKYFLATILMLFVVNAYADDSDFTGNVNLFIGKKSLKSENWSPVENQTAFAVLIDFKQNSWPVSLAFDILYSSKESTVSGLKVEGRTVEFDFGARKIWEVSGTSMRPYIGGGLAYVNAELKGIDSSSLSGVNNSAGYWLNGGIYWTLSPHFNLGMDLRYSDAQLLFSRKSLGGTSTGLILGYHW